jgi:hypothetical protein
MDGWMDGCSNLIGIGSAHARGGGDKDEWNLTWKGFIHPNEEPYSVFIF